jgi:hypothetical protein
LYNTDDFEVDADTHELKLKNAGSEGYWSRQSTAGTGL